MTNEASALLDTDAANKAAGQAARATGELSQKVGDKAAEVEARTQGESTDKAKAD